MTTKAETTLVVSEGTTLAEMTPGERRHLKMLERRVEQGLSTFREVGAALLEIRDTRLYRETHPNFDSYTRDRWGIDRNRAAQFIDAAEVSGAIGDDDDLTNETQARELAPLLHEAGREAVQKVWAEVKATGKPVTAQLIRQTRESILNPQGPTPPTLTERLVAESLRLVVLYHKWEASKPSRKEKNIVSGAMAKLAETATA